MAEAERERSAKSIARRKAGILKSKPNCHSRARSRNSDGTPVEYQKIKDDVLPAKKSPCENRISRSLSDPDIPGFLVISGEEGLFSKKNNGKSKVTLGSSIDNHGNIKSEDRPVFIAEPPPEQKSFGDIKSRFEKAASFDNSLGSQSIEPFMNPLHKANQRKENGEHGVTPKPVKLPVVPELESPTSNESEKQELIHSETKGSTPSIPKLVTSSKPSVAPRPGMPAKPALAPKPVIPAKPVLVPKPVPKPIPTLTSPESLPLIDTKTEHDEEGDIYTVTVVQESYVYSESISDNIDDNLSMEEKGKTTDMPRYPLPRIPKGQHKADIALKATELAHCEERSDQGSTFAKVTKAENVNEEGKNALYGVKTGRSESDPTPLDYSLKTGTKFYFNGQDSISEEKEEEVSMGYDDEGWDSDEFDVDDENMFNDDNQTTAESQECREEEDTLAFPDAKSKKLYNIAHEILTTERTYVERLHLLDQVFYFRLDNECRAQGLVSYEVMQDIFSNIGAIHSLHRDFLLPKLEERMSQWSTNNTIGDILKSLAPFLKLYVAYIANFDKANEALTTWTKRLPKFAAIIEEIQKTRESANLTLQHHMLGPIQRVPRYKMLLTDYIGKLPEDSPDLKNTQEALGIIAEAARHANDSMKKTERFKKLLDIQERLLEEFDLITASREFIKEGDLVKVAARSQAGHQERTLLLFNDKLLCCAKSPGSNKLKVKVAMDLDGMVISEADEDVAIPHSFRITSKQRVIDFSATSEDERQQWVQALNDVIAEYVRKRDSYRRCSQHEVMSDRELGTKAPAWIRDESVTMCMLCDALFTLTRRRHHCRACGRIYCSACCHFKAFLKYCDGKQSRVCQTCFKVLVRGFNESSVRKRVEKAQSLDVKKLSTGNKILLSGFLGYRGGSDKHWVKRWCVVSDNFVFYAYKGRKDTKAAFSLPLPGYIVDKPNLADDVDRKLTFKLHHKNVVVHFFSAEDEKLLQRWMHHLSYAVKAENVPEESTEEQTEEKEGNERPSSMED